MEKNRLKYFQFLLNEDSLPSSMKSFSKFESGYFKDKSTVSKFWNWLTSHKQKQRKNNFYYEKSLKDFYNSYCCDLDWAKTSTYCGGNTTSSSWDNFPCVVELAKSKGISKESNNSYVIGDFRYFPNGRKGIISTKKIVNFTCNDT